MAIIKCPECGHQISDKAPTCPSCGVEIKGKIIKCSHCGEVYLYDQEMCPNCHHANFGPVPVVNSNPYENVQKEQQNPRRLTEDLFDNEYDEQDDSNDEAATPVANDNEDGNDGGNKKKKPSKKKKKNYSAFIVAFVLALIVLAVSGYFYNKTKTEQEIESFEYAMSSKEPMVLQSYLDQHPDAPKDHRDSILARIKFLQEIDKDWTDAIASGSKTVLLDYLEKNPKSLHKNDVLKMVDSIDWEVAVKENSVEAYENYQKEHPQGIHYGASEEAIRNMKSTTLLPEEKQMVNNLIRRFFQSINDKDEKKIQSTVNDHMSNFLGKPNSTRDDVTAFIRRVWKAELSKIIWHVLGDYKITKSTIAENKYQYNVEVTATKRVERKDKKSVPEARYRMNAKVNSDTTIVALDLTKIVEEKKQDDKAKKN
ncbi:MAG: zinc ribbon domain-containing protein [Prevotella sp.]|nr:zinc ribbon domain-containing protein [Prevotella sp.]